MENMKISTYYYRKSLSLIFAYLILGIERVKVELKVEVKREDKLKYMLVSFIDIVPKTKVNFSF